MVEVGQEEKNSKAGIFPLFLSIKFAPPKTIIESTAVNYITGILF